MSQSPRLGLSYILPQQAQKHIAANESFRRLDAIAQLGVKSASIAVEPGAPTAGDSYILPAAPTGASWSSMAEGAVAAFQDGEWLELAPRAGWRAYVEDAAASYVYDGAAWHEEVGGAASGAATFGVNATADATNRLSVKSDAALLSHDDVTPGSGDARQIINKASGANTASVVFQNGFSGRAEFGLAGTDDFSLKVSADGATWKSAIVIDADEANVGVGGAPSSARLTIVGEPGFAGADLVLEKEDYAGFQNFDVYSGTSIYYAPYFQMRRARGTIASPSAVADGDWVGGVSIGVYAPSGAFVTRARMQAIVNGAPSGSSVPVDLAFYAGASGDTERMRIASSGNVAIGKTAPTAKLDVDGAVRVKSYAKAALPAASAVGAGAIAHVADEAGGSVLAFSDGSVWRRVTDRAVVS